MGDAIPCLERFDFGGHVKAMKKTSKELDMILDEWLKERRCNRTLNKKVDRDQDFMDVLLSLFDGTTIEGFADTTIKATMLVCILSLYSIYLYNLFILNSYLDSMIN